MLQMCTKAAIEQEHFECRVHTRSVRVFCGRAEVSVQHRLLGQIVTLLKCSECSDKGPYCGYILSSYRNIFIFGVNIKCDKVYTYFK